MDACAAAALSGQDVPMASAQKSKYKRYIKSPSDIDWNYRLKDQLEPQLTGGPDPKKTFEELCFLRNRIPKMNDEGFDKIFPGTEHCILCAAQKTGARHFIHMLEAASWIINGTHWFSVLKQPMMIIIWRLESRLGRSIEVPVLDADIAGQFR